MNRCRLHLRKVADRKYGWARWGSSPIQTKSLKPIAYSFGLLLYYLGDGLAMDPATLRQLLPRREQERRDPGWHGDPR
jgi:hypothetical protein